jgi:serine/threonine protein kinase
MELLQRHAAGQTSPQENLKLTIHFVKCPSCVQMVEDLKRGAGQLREFTKAHGMSSNQTDRTSSQGAANVETAKNANDNTPQGPARFFPSMPSVQGAELIGPYRLLEKLGEGGMGQVFKAEDTRLQRLVAVKVMNAVSAADPVSRQRFLQEARASAALKHDHIVTIYQVDECSLPGQEGQVPYFAMEFLEGESLEARLRRDKGLRFAEIARIGREVCLGLAAAHARGLIHRDIKPANIWLEQRDPAAGGQLNRVKLLDFGLVRRAGEGKNLTQSGFAVGTPAYMSPEQARCLTLDHRCDLFSLGTVLYQMCTGDVPFFGQDAMATMIALATEQAIPIRQANPKVPTPLAELVMALLAKAPDDRPQSALAVADLLQTIERQLASAPSHQSNVRSNDTAPEPAIAEMPVQPPAASFSWLSGALLKLVGIALVIGVTVYVGLVIFKDFQKDSEDVFKKASPSLVPHSKPASR